MSRRLKKITCPFCGDEPDLDFIYTNPDWHEEECDNCGRCFNYKLIEFDWEDRDYCRYGNSKTNPPPVELDEYSIPSYICMVDTDFSFFHWKYYSWQTRIDHLISLLPSFITRKYFENNRGDYC